MKNLRKICQTQSAKCKTNKLQLKTPKLFLQNTSLRKPLKLQYLAEHNNQLVDLVGKLARHRHGVLATVQAALPDLSALRGGIPGVLLSQQGGVGSWRSHLIMVNDSFTMVFLCLCNMCLTMGYIVNYSLTMVYLCLDMVDDS